jgi:hypothetical protein
LGDRYGSRFRVRLYIGQIKIRGFRDRRNPRESVEIDIAETI